MPRLSRSFSCSHCSRPWWGAKRTAEARHFNRGLGVAGGSPPTMAESSDYKKTLNLPQTSFSMKANLPQNEPKRLEQWRLIDLYKLIREKSEGRPKSVLHDGPPYANGPLHMGHALTHLLNTT